MATPCLCVLNLVKQAAHLTCKRMLLTASLLASQTDGSQHGWAGAAPRQHSDALARRQLEHRIGRGLRGQQRSSRHARGGQLVGFCGACEPQQGMISLDARCHAIVEGAV